MTQECEGAFLRQRQVGGCKVQHSSQSQERPSLAPRARLLRSLGRGWMLARLGQVPGPCRQTTVAGGSACRGAELVGEVGCQECFLSRRGGGT